jgi:putative oxidoreductase
MAEKNDLPLPVTLSTRWSAMAPHFHSALRIAAALMFTLAGTSKLFAFPAGLPPHGGTVSLVSEIGLAGLMEFVGGILMLVGFLTRPVAFLLAGEMAVAYFQVHFPQNFWPTINGGTPAVLYSFIWLYFSAAGAGPWSIDSTRIK